MVKTKKGNVGFEVFTAVVMKMILFKKGNVVLVLK
jgi:hypothetical protein